ncbi:hypothetical protein HYY69_06165 [Candidatus Woesearchaeota archaeon]|nr:hypothetical protein [Candidatus Woesearchaeota archaeon]
MVEATLTIGWGEARKVISLPGYDPRSIGVLGIGASNGELFLLNPQIPQRDGRYISGNPFAGVIYGLEDQLGRHELGAGSLIVSGSRETVPVHYLKLSQASYRSANGSLSTRLEELGQPYQTKPTQQ